MGKSVRSKSKAKSGFFVFYLLISYLVNSLPISIPRPEIQTVDTPYVSESISNVLQDQKIIDKLERVIDNIIEQDKKIVKSENDTRSDFTNYYLRNSLRPGQAANSYTIDITVNGSTFDGRAVISVEIDDNTRGGELRFRAGGLTISSVQFGQFNLGNPQTSPYVMNSGNLVIRPPVAYQTYIFLIEYSGTIGSDGYGIYRGHYDDDDESYLAMNLNPLYARRVFPCMDETTESIRINFNNAGYNNIVSNTQNEGDSNNAEFEPMQGPPHLWGLVAHNFNGVNLPGVTNVRILGRSTAQTNYAAMMTGSIFQFLNDWTEKPYNEIHNLQDGNMQVFAMPDITRDWFALSTVAIWEPYILMVDQHSVKQQITALTTMAKAYANQWFGFVVYPENWKFAWVTTGLAIHAAYESANEADEPIDIASIFLTDIIQESMLKDSYVESFILEPDNLLYADFEVRHHMNGILKLKAPAIMRLLTLVLGDDKDYIKLAASALVNGRSLRPLNSFNFYDAINNEWLFNEGKLVDEIDEFLEPWIQNTGYPIVNVEMRSSGLYLTQERFGFSLSPNVEYSVPLTYTTRDVANFEDIYPTMVMTGQHIINTNLNDGWVIFNIQGQGYYRVSYEEELWDRLIEALEDEESREVIHHLNRASLLDDALNLARAGRDSYNVSLRMALTMNLETHYAPWKSYIRNMDFLEKRLTALGEEDEEDELEGGMYLRMLRRTIGKVEDEIGFSPDRLLSEDLMVTRTRGLVMEHACRVEYDPCVAAAIDWFYDTDNEEPTVNPLIPPDLRPAVYCTMVREGDEGVIDALWTQFEEEPSHYERVVILKSFACSREGEFIFDLLLETINTGGRFGMQERSIFFKAVAYSHVSNTEIALNFLRGNTNAVRNMYGGPEKLEEVIEAIAHNLVTGDLMDVFQTWVNAINSNLDNSLEFAERMSAVAMENYRWNAEHFEYVYNWIDENDAPTLTISIVLLVATAVFNIFN